MKIDTYYDAMALHREDKIIYAHFLKPHRVISTCSAAGGVTDEMAYMYNHQSCEPTKHHTAADRIMKMSDGLYREDVATRYGLPSEKCATLGTAANMRCAAVVTKKFRDTEVVVVATGGVEANGGRAGDPATVYECDGKFERITGDAPTPGTINTMIFISKELTQGALVRSVITATEAKSAALQELSVPSRYSNGLATGTGTDQIGVACLLGTGHPLRSSGKHSKLGELIGSAVREAIKETLVRQNGLSPENRCDMSVHLQRFGGSLSQLKNDIVRHLNSHDAELLRNNILCLNHDPLVVAAVIAMVHVRDQLAWNVLPMSCLPDLFISHGLHIAMAVAGCDKHYEDWKHSLAALNITLDDADFMEMICCALALGFADKWRHCNTESESTCPKKD